MFRNALFTLALGLLIGFAVGYVLGERQPVRIGTVPPPARPAAADTLPEGHPPIPGQGQDAGATADERAASLEARLAENPDDRQTIVTLANLYFDASRWPEARKWYERALALQPDDANVLTDLAVVHRNLQEYDTALDLLARAVEIDSGKWQAWFNRAIILHYDLHRHDEALAAVERLRVLRADNPQVPDTTALEREIAGGE